jgi:hypothetical protein
VNVRACSATNVIDASYSDSVVPAQLQHRRSGRGLQQLPCMSWVLPPKTSRCPQTRRMLLDPQRTKNPRSSRVLYFPGHLWMSQDLKDGGGGVSLFPFLYYWKKSLNKTLDRRCPQICPVPSVGSRCDRKHRFSDQSESFSRAAGGRIPTGSRSSACERARRGLRAPTNGSAAKLEALREVVTFLHCVDARSAQSCCVVESDTETLRIRHRSCLQCGPHPQLQICTE